MGYIYMVTCLKTNKKYIGKTEINIETRWKQHCDCSQWPSHGDYNFPFHRAIRKYGKNNFKIEKIEECDNNLLNEKEKYWIKYYNTYEDGYNASLGGDGHSKYDYDNIVNYYLSHNFSILETCKNFNIYDQVVYNALKSKNIDYKKLKSSNKKNNYNKKILLVEKNIIFNNMKEIDEYFGKQVHGNIRRCLNGVTKKAYGFTWKEID